jgi:hypothetical protein
MSKDNKKFVTILITMVLMIGISLFLLTNIGSSAAKTSVTLTEYDDRLTVEIEDIDERYPHVYIANNSKIDEAEREIIYIGDTSEKSKYTLYESDYPDFIHSNKYQIVVADGAGDDYSDYDAYIVADKNSIPSIGDMGYVDKRTDS